MKSFWRQKKIQNDLANQFIKMLQGAVFLTDEPKRWIRIPESANDPVLLLGVSRMLWQDDWLRRAGSRDLEKTRIFLRLVRASKRAWAVLLRHAGGLGWVISG